MSKAAAGSIPVFKLYGESQDWPTPDLLHCETIPKRSRLYHWEIQPHRHADLCQLLYVHQGLAEVDIEGQRHQIREATIQVVPPLCVHGFHFSEDIEGYVLTLAAPLVAQFQAQIGSSVNALALAASYPAGDSRTYLHSLFSALQSEYAGDQPARDMLLRSLVSVLLVWVSRQVIRREEAAQTPERGREYLSRFTALVEAHFREQPSVEQLAHRVGISVAHLNSTCRELAEQSALQIIHQRLLLEAKRNLIYTSMSISQLADSLGFVDPAYFSRFFRRMSGMSPKAFRAGESQ